MQIDATAAPEPARTPLRTALTALTGFLVGVCLVGLTWAPQAAPAPGACASPGTYSVTAERNRNSMDAPGWMYSP